MSTAKKAASVFNMATTRKTHAAPNVIDPELLVVEHDYKLPKYRMAEGKFDAVFRQMRPGSAIKCEPSEVATLCGALRKAIQSEKYPALIGCSVRQVTRAQYHALDGSDGTAPRISTCDDLGTGERPLFVAVVEEQTC